MEEQTANKKIIIILWILAFIITAFVAYYQRVTGPTYPVSGSVTFQGKDIFYKFDRSGSTDENCIVKVNTTDNQFKGVILWKRYKTNDDESRVDMKNENGVLTGELPKQPPAGKLVYKVRIIGNNTEVTVPSDNPVVIRFKDNVPFYILIPHILFMFFAMLFSTRTGIETFRKVPDLKKLTYWTIGLLTIGGMILGPIALKYAFGMYWEGIPFGFDLTDNKTLIIWVAWILAAIMLFKSKNPKYWILGAAVVTLIVFLIPHSLFGTAINYNKV